jgi:hypothetical protein
MCTAAELRTDIEVAIFALRHLMRELDQMSEIDKDGSFGQLVRQKIAVYTEKLDFARESQKTGICGKGCKAS